jgi:hypothetical protein
MCKQIYLLINSVVSINQSYVFLTLGNTTVWRALILLLHLFYYLETIVLPKSIIYQQIHLISVLENVKIYIKTYIKIAATCFGLRPSSGGLHMNLAKVTFIKLVKVRRYGL